MKDIKRKYISNVNLSKFTSNKKISSENVTLIKLQQSLMPNFVFYFLSKYEI